MLIRRLLCYSANRRAFLCLSIASLATLLFLAPRGNNSESGAQLSSPTAKHPDDHEVGKKIENRGSSSIAGEISELSGNSAGLSLSGEQPEESEEEMGGNLFVPQSPPRLVVPSEKSSSDSEEVEIDFLAQHRLQFLALLEAISMRNFSSTDWDFFMAYKVGDVNVEQMAKLLLFVKQ